MKKTLIILTLLANIILISLIPLNKYVLNMKECISIIMAEIIILLNILTIITNKKINKTIIIISIISIIFGLYKTYCNPNWNSVVYRNETIYTKEYNHILTKTEALEDLEYAMKYLKKVHPRLLKNIPENLEKQYNIVKNNIENEEYITTSFLEKNIESIFSKLNDAHTRIYPVYENYHLLKQLYTHNENNERLKKINGKNIEEIFEENKQYYSYEMEEAAYNQFRSDVIYLEKLNKLGLNGEEITYTFELNKKLTDYTYHKEDFITPEEYNEYNNITPQPKTSFVTYEIDKENNIAILYLDECNNTQEYKNVLNEMFNEIKENNIENVAVDLRNNGGGDSSVATEFLKYINIDEYEDWKSEIRRGIFNIKTKKHTIKNKKKNNVFDGNLYVLTSIDTFSSAMDFAMLIKDNKIGTIIGEASSNDPNSYGMITRFILPNSKLYAQISTKKWYRVNERTEEKFIEPDIKCESEDAIFKLYDKIKSTSEN